MWIALTTALVAVVVVVVLVVFQPQKLFLDDKVNEAVPTASEVETAEPAGGDRPGDIAAPTDPVTLRRGTFISRDHGTEGTANVLDVSGMSYLRIEDLDTDNGPSLVVYLTATPADGAEDTFDDDFVDLGGLKGNIGNQNYEIPAGTDLDRYQSVVIWCDRFDAAFGAANLL